MKDIELEYKFWVSDKEGLMDALNKDALLKKDRCYQNNIMFDNPAGLMQLTDGRVRVRTTGGAGEKVLTYKKPLPSQNGAKREIEYEISFVDSEGKIEKILEAMEFFPTTSYERHQTKWEMNGAYITLDEYPYADIIEIEGGANEIESAAYKLGFDIKQGLTKPVDTLFQEWRKERGLPMKSHMRFDDFDK